jgi:hypothetical protein
MWEWILLVVLFLLLITLSRTASNYTSSPLTVVSGYWKIKSKHTDEDYDKWFKNTLVLNAPYVFFHGDDETKNRISKFRGDLETVFIKRNIEDFKSAKTYDDKWTHDYHLPDPRLGKIWTEKVKMVDEAIKLNPYNSEWFAWIDAGNSYYRTMKPSAEKWPSLEVLSKLPKDKIIFAETNEAEHDFAGGVFMYHKDIANEVSKVFYEEYSSCGGRYDDWQCGSDQCIFTEVKKKIPDLFHSMGKGIGGDVLKYLT